MSLKLLENEELEKALEEEKCNVKECNCHSNCYLEWVESEQSPETEPVNAVHTCFHHYIIAVQRLTQQGKKITYWENPIDDFGST